jgi:hypothetical protein
MLIAPRLTRFTLASATAASTVADGCQFPRVSVSRPERATATASQNSVFVREKETIHE